MLTVRSEIGPYRRPIAVQSRFAIKTNDGAAFVHKSARNRPSSVRLI
jgi:hypothetical protein